jgi:hypothetical protein
MRRHGRDENHIDLQYPDKGRRATMPPSRPEITPLSDGGNHAAVQHALSSSRAHEGAIGLPTALFALQSHSTVLQLSQKFLCFRPVGKRRSRAD